MLVETRFLKWEFRFKPQILLHFSGQNGSSTMLLGIARKGVGVV